MDRIGVYGRFLVLAVLFVTLAGSASALSCFIQPDNVIVHCPEDGDCTDMINASELRTTGVSFETVEVPSPGENTTLSTEYMSDIIIQTERNTDLPSAETAFSHDRKLCPQGEMLHLYPTHVVEKEYLEDLTDCYETTIEELDHYYMVWRERTTEPWYCVEKVAGQQISGGTYYAEPIDAQWIIRNALPYALLLFLLLVTGWAVHRGVFQDKQDIYTLFAPNRVNVTLSAACIASMFGSFVILTVIDGITNPYLLLDYVLTALIGTLYITPLMYLTASILAFIGTRRPLFAPRKLNVLPTAGFTLMTGWLSVMLLFETYFLTDILGYVPIIGLFLVYTFCSVIGYGWDRFQER